MDTGALAPGVEGEVREALTDLPAGHPRGPEEGVAWRWAISEARQGLNEAPVLPAYLARLCQPSTVAALQDWLGREVDRQDAGAWSQPHGEAESPSCHYYVDEEEAPGLDNGLFNLAGLGPEEFRGRGRQWGVVRVEGCWCGGQSRTRSSGPWVSLIRAARPGPSPKLV